MKTYFDLFRELMGRAWRISDSHPWILLTPDARCPLHPQRLLLPVDHDYWMDSPAGADPRCRCMARSVSRKEYRKLVADKTIRLRPRTDPAGAAAADS